MIIELRDVQKNYHQGHREISILKGLNLQLERGKTLSIVGESGSGKSTLLGLLAGLDRPDQGIIKINNMDLNNLDEKDITKFRGRHIGIVFQSYYLVPHLTAFENVMLPLEINRTSETVSKAHLALEQVKLLDRKDHFPNQLSGGECQRVAIARAIVHRPDVVLADEPSGNLDVKTGNEVMNMMLQVIQQHQMTLLLVTHSPELAKQCEITKTLRNGCLE